MSSSQDTVDFVISRMMGAGEVSYKKMFGEYGIYCDGKMVASVCDDQLFIKPTPGGKAFIGETVDVPPYPGARPAFLISAEKIKDGPWLSELARITARELPIPVKRNKPAKKSGSRK